jgi:ABC-type branched-subunit amino acid transport system substrate-binding protein
MKKYLLCVMAIVTVVFFGLTFTAAAEEGVTDTEIHIGQWGPQTGPAAPWGAVARGTDAYFKMINAEGGIHGRKLIHHYFDDGYNPAKTKAGVKQLQEDVGMFAWVSGVGTAPGLAVKDYLMERKIPWIGPSAGSRHWVEPPHKYLFNVYPLYLGDAQALCQYAVIKLGFKRIAIAYQNDDYGKQGLEGAQKQLAKLDLKLVAEIPVNVADTDMKPHIMKFRKAKAEAVLLFVGPGHVARLQGTGKAMKFEPQWMTSSTCSDVPLMMYITKGGYAGTIFATFARVGQFDKGRVEDPNDPSLPLSKKYFTQAFKKYAAKEERWGMTFGAGFSYVEPFVEALKRCGRELTREKLVAEMEKLQDFQGSMSSVSYAPFKPNDPSCRLGTTSVWIGQATADAKMKILTGWIQTEYIPMSH